MTPKLIAVAAVALGTVALIGCTAAQPAPAGSGSPAHARTLTVFAASSLKGAFAQIGDDFAATRPGVSVRLSLDGSSALVDRLVAGAPADVFASADATNMTRAVDAGVVEAAPLVFATNVLTLVVPPDNPGRITGLDASLIGKKLVVCADGVPCGTAATALATKLGVTLTPVSREQKVSDVLGKVTSGEADAGLVYTTDAKAAGDKVAEIAIPAATQTPNRYLIAATADARDKALAESFATYVSGPYGQAVLTRFGFGRP